MKRRFKVVFNREKCKGCELCINFCPKGILALDPEV
ncbi:MAG: 4Fe-4S binding protein, partial [Eubacterium sp.]|nr:4Fe-4S binding protein [Eubacterium sp.]